MSVMSTLTMKTSKPAALSCNFTQWSKGWTSLPSTSGPYLTSRYQHYHIYQMAILYCYHLHYQFNPSIVLNIEFVAFLASVPQYHYHSFHYSPSCLGWWRGWRGAALGDRWQILHRQCISSAWDLCKVQVLTGENVCCEVCKYFPLVLCFNAAGQYLCLSFQSEQLITPGS